MSSRRIRAPEECPPEGSATVLATAAAAGAVVSAAELVRAANRAGLEAAEDLRSAVEARADNVPIRIRELHVRRIGPR